MPDLLCRTIAQHQRDDEEGTVPTQPLARALRGGTLLAGTVAAGEVDDTTCAALATITAGAVGDADVRALALRTAAHAAGLVAAMS